MTRITFRWALACMAAILTVMAISVTPALADHKGDAHGPDGQKDGNFQEADDAASEDSETAPRGSSRSRANRGNTTSSTEESSSTTQSQTTSDDEQDGSGKYWDQEGSPRGESSTQCENTHGGTGSGRVYDSTCDGSASKAGNGGGGAGGRPCAGCVGNADYKEPAGQLKDGNHDGNAGYECDGNNGVARSNPAHTSCRTPSITELCPPGTDLSGLPVPPAGCDLPEGELCPPGTDLAGSPPGPNGCDEVLSRTDKVCPEGTDFAGRDMTDVKDCVLGTRFHDDPTPPLGAILPFTGATDLAPFITIGLLLMALGLAGLRIRKSA